MDERYYQLLMEDFFLQTGIKPTQKRDTSCAVSVDDLGILLIANQPSGWVTLFLKIGDRPAYASEQWLRRILIENARLDKAIPKSSLGVIENVLVQWTQLPLEYLSVQILRQWVERFLEAAKKARNLLIINWKENKDSINPPVNMAEWQRI